MTSRGFGWYERDGNPTGALLPTEITEFANAGLLTGLATVNLATDPFTDSKDSGVPARLTGPSPTSSTDRCGFSASWLKTAS